MAKNLLEAYKNRLAISESVYGKAHMGEKMDSNKKLAVAKCLENTNSFLNEAFDSAAATQRSDMGLWKKFCLNLTTVALPNLISHELVIVHPMSSMSGYITYIEYSAGTTKGETTQGDVFNSPFALGKVDQNYTANAVVETVENFQSGTTKIAWTPIALDENNAPIIKFLDENGAALEATGVEVAADGTVTATVSGVKKIAYKYDNVVIPQNDLPTLKAEMKSIPLIAKARRIAVYYSQIAAFQAKTDYGVDLGDQLAEKAVGQLSYEIDTEVCNLLIETAGEAKTELTWSKTLPVGVSKREHYDGFAEMVEIGKKFVYDATKRFVPNYMLCASDIMPILAYLPQFSPAPTGQINGPYFAGTLGSIKVFVTPNIEPGKFVIGVNGDDMMSSVAVYAPYMAIVPTQLLQYADGGTTQGWSTLYDLKVLNDKLIVAGQITA